MDRNALIKYINENKGADVPSLQRAFNLGYGEVQSAINKLVEEGKLVYTEGVRYSLKQESKRNPFEEYTRRRRNSKNNDGEPKSDFSFLFGKDDETKDIPSANDLSEEMKKDALKFAVDLGKISVSDLVVRFMITYVKANALILWMQSMNYISGYKSGNGGKRDVLISAEDFEFLYGDEDEEDEDGDGITDILAELDTEISKREKEEIDGKFKNVCKKVASKQSAKELPAHPSWDDESEFDGAVRERMEKLIKSDINMGWQRAVKKAENYLEAVRDTCDKKMIEVYEWLLFEIKGTGNYLYSQLKKQFFG